MPPLPPVWTSLAARFTRHVFPGTREAWHTLKNRGLRAAVADARQLRPGVAHLVAEGGLVVDFPANTAEVQARFVLQADGDVLLQGTPEYFSNPSAQTAHFVAIHAMLEQVRNILSSTSALFITGHAVIWSGASVSALIVGLRTDLSPIWIFGGGIALSGAASMVRRYLLGTALRAALRR